MYPLTMFRAPGASPLTRGKRYLTASGMGEGGRIPAHAGKTGQFAGELHLPGAHPRSRGENDGERAGADRLEGASPLTRGKRW